MLQLLFAGLFPLSILALSDFGSKASFVDYRPAPPVFPDSYEVAYTYILPYVRTVQTAGLSYSVHIWFDGKGKKLKMSVLDGLDSLIQIGNKTLSLYPRIEVMKCDVSYEPSGPTSLKEGATKPLPDMSAWVYGGSTVMKNARVLIWKLQFKNGEKVNTYTFYVTKEGHPVQLHMMGFNIMAGSHFDEYIIDFSVFKPGPVATSAFQIPQICLNASQADERSTLKGEQNALPLQLLTLLPSRSVGSLESFELVSDPAQLVSTQPTSPYLLNKQFVDAFNQENSNGQGFRLALNRFAHWSQEQWAATMLGRKTGAYSVTSQRGRYHLGTYQRILSNFQLPSSVDWRGTGADGIVKDQASCGSCWAFSAVGAMQSAWYLATGQQLSFSEQQLVDCSWNFGNEGCGGGWEEPAFEYIIGAGGVAGEEEYPYIGQNGFCRFANVTKSGFFKGYKNIPKRDPEALKEALLLYGPMAISIDAESMEFRFYSEGVYTNPNCKSGPDELNHAVVLVGYGTSPAGEDYWLIRNSWSKYWGEDGYIKINRKFDCGVTTDPVMVVVDESLAAMRKGGVQKQYE